MAQASVTTTTIPAAATAEQEASTAKIVALLGGLQPRRINVVRGASFDDILNVQDDIAHAFDLLVAYVGRELVKLNANISEGHVLFNDALALLADAQSEIAAALNVAAERVAEGG